MRDRTILQLNGTIYKCLLRIGVKSHQKQIPDREIARDLVIITVQMDSIVAVSLLPIRGMLIIYCYHESKATYQGG